jgi:cytochrome c553
MGDIVLKIRISPQPELSKMTRTLQALLVSTALVLIPVTSWSEGSNPTAPINAQERAALSPSRDMIEHGRNVAGTACAKCHGADGVSTEAGVPHLAGQRTIYLYRMLQAYQERARKNDSMNHAVGFLNDEALLAVAAYYANLAPARPEPPDEQAAGAGGVDEGDPFAGIRPSMKKCVKCHGDTGNSSASGMPNLTAQAPEYFVAAMNSYVQGGRNHKLMKKLVAGLDEAAIDAMGVFYAVQQPLRTETVGDGNADAGRAGSEHCAACHGDDGNASGTDMPSLAGQDARYFIKAMEAYKEGEREHESMFDAANELSDTEIRDLAAFYAGQEPIRRNVRVPFTTAEWIDRCERCHGLDGNSRDPRFPMLAGQDASYMRKALRKYTEEGNGSSTMHKMADPLSEADIGRIVSHYSAQEPKSVLYMQLPCEEGAEE